MAEYNSEKNIKDLLANSKYYNKLYIDGFANMMKDPSYCYKFYWLEAIVKLVLMDVRKTTLDAVINEMICNAWYSVREFHIHLSGLPADGNIKDGLERAIIKLSEVSNLSANASKLDIQNAIADYDAELKSEKEQLTNMVPYRALAGFFTKAEEQAPWNGIQRITDYIWRVNEKYVLLPYVLGNGSKLNKEIIFQPEWIAMIQDNAVSILGWIQFEKVKWLQNNNPEVPGLVYKLDPMDERSRKLNHVRKLWESLFEIDSIKDIYTNETINVSKYDIDHFVPWSFVMNDELWNLMPIDPSLNSSKSNKLPNWDRSFSNFAENQYKMYGYVQTMPQIRKLFEKCYKDNLHSIWAGRELYRNGNQKEEFINILYKNMRPVYDSAKRQGYSVWVN